MAGVAQQRAAGHIPSPEGLATPPGDYGTWDDYMQTVEEDGRRENAWMRDEEAIQGLKAMRLSPNLNVYRALITGQPVPADAMDQQWLRRYTR